MYFKTLLNNVYLNNQMNRFKTILIRKNGTKLIDLIETQLIDYLKENIKTNTELVINVNDFIKNNKKLNTDNTKKLIDDVLTIIFEIAISIELSVKQISKTEIQLSGWDFNIDGFMNNPIYDTHNSLSQQYTFNIINEYLENPSLEIISTHGSIITKSIIFDLALDECVNNNFQLKITHENYQTMLNTSLSIIKSNIKETYSSYNSKQLTILTDMINTKVIDQLKKETDLTIITPIEFTKNKSDIYFIINW